VKLSTLYRACTPAGILLAAGLAFGQARKPADKDLPPSAFKLVAVSVTGGERYKSEDVLAASGLEIGETVHEEDFKDAARRLGDSGAFREISYSFQYAPEGTKLQFQVQDAQAFVPARFENVVWFSDQELLDQIHQRVPLFRGQLPVNGGLADLVSEALQALLIEKSIQGSAEYVRAGPDNGPVEAFVFSVSGPRISVRNFDFHGADPGMLPLLQAAAQRIDVREYSRSALRTQGHKYLLPVYLARGYLKASFGDPQARVVESTADEATVDVSFAVDPGPQYVLSGIELAGNKVFSTETLRGLIHVPLNQPADVVQLARDLESMENLYGTRGFMAAKITSEHQMDDARRTLLCKITVSEGDVFTMGELDIRGVDSETTARLRNMWTIRNGEPYDSSYPERFAEQAYKQVALLKNSKADIHESPNPSDKTVDVTLRFDIRP